MCAIRVHGMDLILNLRKEHLSPFNALDFDFLLLSILQVDLGKILELEFGSHGSKGGGECRSLSWDPRLAR